MSKPKIGVQYDKYPMNERELKRQYLLEIAPSLEGGEWDIRVMTPTDNRGVRRQTWRSRSVKRPDGERLAAQIALKYRIPQDNVKYVTTANDTHAGIEYDQDHKKIETPTDSDGGSPSEDEHR